MKGIVSATYMDPAEVVYRFRWQIAFILVGIILSAVGIYLSSVPEPGKAGGLEIIASSAPEVPSVIVEVAGAVNKPGVYTFVKGSRIADAIEKAEGIKEDADRQFLDKFLNRAAPVTDGQKLYIPYENEQSDKETAKENGGDQTMSSDVLVATSKAVNINTASQKELEELWGIGPVTAQNIIEQRPYSTVDELMSKGILKSNVYERNKDLLSVY